MADLERLLTDALQRAFAGALGDEYATADPVLRPSEHADFQANAAMALGKRAGRPPREVATDVVAHLDLDGVTATVAGPGFVNLVVDDALLGRLVDEQATSDTLGIEPATRPERAVVDYSGPNVAKEMHIGHLRSSIIGDAIVRVLEARGHTVIRQNHVGDWGTQFGMLIEHVLDTGVDLDADVETIADWSALYQAAKSRFDGDTEFATRARRRVVALQRGDATTGAVWARLVGRSEEHFSEVYAQLGIGLTPGDVRGESSYNDDLPGVVHELEAAGLLVEDQGALCAFAEPYRDGSSDGGAPLIVRKSDGGFGYATTDLAALRHRVRDLGADRLVYVVDARQSQHFAQVFDVARRAGWLDGARAEHVAFGTILGPDGRPFRTRSGDTVALTAVLDEAVERARAIIADKNPAIVGAERDAVARDVGIGAVKYADLVNDRVKDYVFDWDRLLNFDGNTAPYLQYACVRIRSVFREAGVPFGAASGPVLPATTSEHALALALLAFPAAVTAVERTLQPHRLCSYVYGLASAFTAFYEECRILVDDTPTRTSRLVLAQTCARVLESGLGLLGIAVPDRM